MFDKIPGKVKIGIIVVIAIIILTLVAKYLNKMSEKLDYGIYKGEPDLTNTVVDSVMPQPMSVDKTESKEITPLDLLPKNAAVDQWNSQFPSDASNLNDKNFLTAGYQIGINTVSSSLKNANLQLRNDPYIPVGSGPVVNQSSVLPNTYARDSGIGTSC